MASENILKLAARLSADIGYPVDPESFQRTYAGHNQKAAGACSWVIRYGQHNVNEICGFEPVKKYLEKKNQLHYMNPWPHVTEVYAVGPKDFGYKTPRKK